MIRNRRRIAAVVFGLVTVVLVVVATGGFQPQTYLIIEDTNETELQEIAVERGATVSLEYTHSVEKTEIRDVYEVREDGLQFVYMEFNSFGAGLPSEAEVNWTESGTLIYEVPNDEPDSVTIATGTVAGHELVVNDSRLDLVELADGGSVRLRVDHRYGI